MNEPSPLNFGDRLLAVDRLPISDRDKLLKEIHEMFVRELAMPRRIVFGVVSIAAVLAAALCAFLAFTEKELPTMARVGLGTGTVFGVSWAAIASRICVRGVIDVKQDGQRIAAMVWVFTVLMMAFFLMIGMSIEDRILGLMMIANGLAFLVGAAVYWLTHRIEQSELSTRERLLKLELLVTEGREQG